MPSTSFIPRPCRRDRCCTSAPRRSTPTVRGAPARSASGCSSRSGSRPARGESRARWRYDLWPFGIKDRLSGSRSGFARDEDPFEAGPVRGVAHIDQRVPRRPERTLDLGPRPEAPGRVRGHRRPVGSKDIGPAVAHTVTLDLGQVPPGLDTAAARDLQPLVGGIAVPAQPRPLARIPGLEDQMAAGSTPATSMPRSASRQAKVPVPQPTSSTLRAPNSAAIAR